MDETTKTEGSTTINQYPNNGGWGWGGPGAWGYPGAYPAYGGFGDLMRSFGGNINIGRGGGMTGTALGLAIAALGIPVVGALAGRGFGWGGQGCDNLVTKDYVGMLEKNNALLAENGQLKAQIYTDNKIDGVVKTLVEWRQRQELIDTQVAAEVATLKQENANLKTQLGSMLGTYITPNVMLPSQAVASQIQAAKASTTSGS